MGFGLMPSHAMQVRITSMGQAGHLNIAVWIWKNFFLIEKKTRFHFRRDASSVFLPLLTVCLLNEDLYPCWTEFEAWGWDRIFTSVFNYSLLSSNWEANSNSNTSAWCLCWWRRQVDSEQQVPGTDLHTVPSLLLPYLSMLMMVRTLCCCISYRLMLW